VGFISRLVRLFKFGQRTIQVRDCEACTAYRHTIALQHETIAMLKTMVADERSLNRDFLYRMRVIEPQKSESGGEVKQPQPVRQTRTPWHRKQAELESESRKRYWEQKAVDAEQTISGAQRSANPEDHQPSGDS
jgi:hypothetical protein